jgi:hypothetical protein
VQRAETGDLVASHALMATVWRAVSQAQAVLGRRRLSFEPTLADERLSEQLSLFGMLHDWQPVTESEATDLRYLLGLYVEPAADATPDTVARTINVAIRTMAVRRAAAGPFGQSRRD